MSMRKLVAIGAAAGLFVAFSVFVVSGLFPEHTVMLVDDFTFVVLSWTAAVFAALAARAAHGRTRTAWVAMTVGLVAAAVGDTAWAVFEFLGHKTPTPTFADWAYLTFPVAACVALMLFWSAEGGRTKGLVVADGMIIGASLFIVSWLLVLLPVASSFKSNGLERAITLAYPLSGLMVLTVAAVTLVRAGAHQRLPATLLALGMACSALSDNAYALLMSRSEYASGNVTDIGYLACLLLITFAAIEGFRPGLPEDTGPRRPGWASIWLPYAPMLLAAALVGVSEPSALRSPPVAAAAVVIAVGILVRQYLSVREDRQLLAAVGDQASRDPLTGLANRTLFNDRLVAALRRDGPPKVVLLVDLDDFKMVNDTLGHAVGDELLISVAERLRRCVPPGATVCRLGGDEFAILLEGSPQAARWIADLVVRAFDAPFVVHGLNLTMRLSVGVAVADDRDGAGEMSPDELLTRADLAMYMAKRSRAGGVHVFTGEEDATATGHTAYDRPAEAAAIGAIHMLGELRDAVERRELDLVYQPKIDLRTREAVGVEALLRWPHPQRGTLGPDLFLPVVARHGLQDAVNDFVINRALDDARRWRSAGIRLPVAINLFAPSLADPKLPDRLDRALTERQLHPTDVTIEITEQLFSNQPDRMRAVLKRLRDKGVRIAIDDFGSGYSALSMLRDLAIDEVKLDRELITSVATEPRTAAIVRAVVDLAHEFGLSTVAEGVETAAEVERLAELGCDVAQGYFFRPALSSEELITVLKAGVTEPAPSAVRRS